MSAVPLPSPADAVPHRWPMLLVDRLDEVVAGRSARGLRQLTLSDAHREDDGEDGGPAPDFPVTLLIDALGQVAIAALSSHGSPGVWLLAGLEGFEVAAPALPGHELTMEAEVGRGFRGTYRVAVRATAGGGPVAHGTMVLVDGGEGHG